MHDKRGEKAAETGSGGGRTEKKKPAVALLKKDSAQGKAADSGPDAPPVRKKRVTIADIARRAGVSPATVSITLADRRDIAIPEVTRDRVKRCADDLGYRPSRLGEGFLRGRSKLVGVLALTDSYLPFLNLIAGIQEGLASADYIPLVVSSNWLSGYQGGSAPSRQRLDELPGLSRLLEYQVEGVLYFSTDSMHTAACIEELDRRRIPTVILGGVDPDEGNGNIDVVGGDNEAIGRLVAEHLLSVGCTSFAFGMPAFFHAIDEVVRSSFIGRLKAAGYACGEFIVDRKDPRALDLLLPRMVKPPAGVFATQDSMAALALQAAFALGWRVPRDFAVVGMGQTELARFNALPLTAVDRNSFVSGETAARLLVQRMEGFTGRPQRILIPPSLEIRPSSVSDGSWMLSSEF